MATQKFNEAAVSARTAALEKQGEGMPRHRAAMEWDMHTGRIPKSDWPDGWKDPYAKLDKASKASKAKPKTAKAKAKK